MRTALSKSTFPAHTLHTHFMTKNDRKEKKNLHDNRTILRKPRKKIRSLSKRYTFSDDLLHTLVISETCTTRKARYLDENLAQETLQIENNNLLDFAD